MRIVSIVLLALTAAWAQHQIPAAGGGIRNVATLPATCTPTSSLNMVFLTTGTVGPYACRSTNTWTFIGVAGQNPSASSASAVTSLTVDTTALALTTTNSIVYSCWSGTTTTRAPVAVTSVSGLSLTSITLNFASTANVSCAVNSTGGAGPQGAAGPTGATGSQGPAGSTGATGPGYAATSTTSLAIGTGSKTFTTQAGLAYLAGVRAKAVSAANSANFMHGLVTSYSGTSLVINMDTTGGSGTLADWNIGLHGDTGATGAQGPTGPAGSVDTEGGGNLTNNAIVRGAGLKLTKTGTGATLDDDGDATFKSVETTEGTAASTIRIKELAVNGENFRRISVPDTLTDDLDHRYPDALPTEGQIMKWGAPSGGVSQGSYFSPTKSIGAVFNGGGSALTSGTTVGSSLLYTAPLPTACTVVAWTVTVDAGTAGFRVWRAAAGTAVPAVGGTLNDADLAITTGTNLRSTTMTGFIGDAGPSLAANDILAFQLNAAATATYAAVSLQCL